MELGLKNFRLSSIVLLSVILLGSLITSCHFFAQSMDMHSSNEIAAMQVHFDEQNNPVCCQMQSGQNPLQNTIADISKKALPGSASLLFSLSLMLFGLSYLLIANKVFVSKLYYIQHLFRNCYNYLIQIFSQGILQPQIYNA